MTTSRCRLKKILLIIQGQQPGIPAEFPGLPQIPNLPPSLNGIPSAQQSLQFALAQNPHLLSNPHLLGNPQLLKNPQLLGNHGLFQPRFNGHQPHGLFPIQIPVDQQIKQELKVDYLHYQGMFFLNTKALNINNCS